MFKDIGKKIKGLASIICWVGIIGYVLAAFIMFGVTAYTHEGGFAAAGALLLIIGPLSAWVGSFFMYGFGELIDKTAEIARNTAPTNKDECTQPQTHNQRVEELGSLLRQNLITEEEYRQAISKENI